MHIDAIFETDTSSPKTFKKMLFSFERINNIEYMALISFWSAMACIMFMEAIFFIELPSFIDKTMISHPVTDVLAYTVLFGCSFIIMINYIVIAIRRLHDCNLRGWWWLLILIPVVGVIVGFLGGIALLITPGTKGRNRFGAQPAKATIFHYSLLLLGPVMFGCLYWLLYSLIVQK